MQITHKNLIDALRLPKGFEGLGFALVIVLMDKARHDFHLAPGGSVHGDEAKDARLHGFKRTANADFGIGFGVKGVDADIHGGGAGLDNLMAAFFCEQKAVGGQRRGHANRCHIRDKVHNLGVEQGLALAGIADKTAGAQANLFDLVHKFSVQSGGEHVTRLALWLNKGDIGAMDAGKITKLRDVDDDLRWKIGGQIVGKKTLGRHCALRKTRLCEGLGMTSLRFCPTVSSHVTSHGNCNGPFMHTPLATPTCFLSARHLIETGRFKCLALNLAGTLLPYPAGLGEPTCAHHEQEVVGLINAARARGMALVFLCQTEAAREVFLKTLGLEVADHLQGATVLVGATWLGAQGLMAQLLEVCGGDAATILYLATLHREDRRAAQKHNIPLVYINGNEAASLRSHASGMPDSYDTIMGQCEAIIDTFDRTGQFDRSALLTLFCTPAIETRRFIYGFFLIRFLDRARGDFAITMRKKLWKIGMHDHSAFLALAEHYSGSIPDATTWTFIRDALMEAERTTNISYVMELVTVSHRYAYLAYNAGVSYAPFQDYYLLKMLQKLLKPLQPKVALQLPLEGRRIRLCYVLSAEVGEDYSPLFDSALALAEGHDPAQFEVSIASAQQRHVAMASARVAQRLTALESKGIKLFFQPDIDESQTTEEYITGYVEQLAAQQFDTMIFTTMTSTPVLFAALRPAPLLVGLGFGDIDIYSSPLLDFAIQWLDYPVMDSLCQTHRVPDFMPAGRFEKPSRPIARSEVGVPKDAVLIISSGRPLKYKFHPYWRIVAAILSARPKTHIAIIGPQAHDVAPWVEANVPSALRERIHFLGWRNDHLDVLAMADIVLDTIPMGGGFNLTEAMNLGIPTVICRNRSEDFLDLYTNEHLLPIGEILTNPELCFDWDDEEGLTNATLRLIDDPAWRRSLKEEMERFAAKRLDRSPTQRCFEQHIMDHLRKLGTASVA